jgi:hypothetical protein
MLLACRLAGLSGLEADYAYASLVVVTQSGLSGADFRLAMRLG